MKVRATQDCYIKNRLRKAGTVFEVDEKHFNGQKKGSEVMEAVDEPPKASAKSDAGGDKKPAGGDKK